MTDAMPAALDFDGFFRREYPRLVHMLHVLVGDRELAEDLAQDTLVKAHAKWPRIASYESPGAWAHRVALNSSINARRRRGREATALRRVGVQEMPSAHHEPDAVLWKAVRGLPDQQRWAVALFYAADLPVAHIATVLECSEGTVKTHLSRARESLGRAIGFPEKETP